LFALCDCAPGDLPALELDADCVAEFAAPAADAVEFAPVVVVDADVADGATAAPLFAAPSPPAGAVAAAALAAAAAALFAASISASVSIASGKSIAAGFGARSNSSLYEPKPNCAASMR
jgi:hypothetical protein